MSNLDYMNNVRLLNCLLLYTDWKGNLNDLHISDLSRDHGLNTQPFICLSSTLVHKDMRTSALVCYSMQNYFSQKFWSYFHNKSQLKTLVNVCRYNADLIWLLQFSNIYLQSRISTYSQASRTHKKNLTGHKFKIQVTTDIVFMKGSKRESNVELLRIISTKGDRNQSNVIGMPAMQLAYDCAIHHGGSYDVQQHVISKKHQRSARQSSGAGVDRSLQHRPVVRDTKQMQLWCVIRFAFAFAHCRSKHWHRGWKIAGSVLSQAFFDQRLH